VLKGDVNLTTNQPSYSVVSSVLATDGHRKVHPYESDNVSRK